MRFRSTGLGKTELKGTMADLSPSGDDLLVFHIETFDPVKPKEIEDIMDKSI